MSTEFEQQSLNKRQDFARKEKERSMSSEDKLTSQRNQISTALLDKEWYREERNKRECNKKNVK